LAVQDPTEWNQIAAALPHGHLLQSWEWGEFKSRYRWRPRRLVWNDVTDRPAAGAQVLTRSTLRGALRVMYVPKGPLLDWDNSALRAQVLDDLQALARRERAILIKIDPDVQSVTPHPQPLSPTGGGAGGEGRLEAVLHQRGWRFSPEQVQFRNTVTLDLSRPEEDILAAMKPKTRYNIRLASKKGVRVRPGTLSDLGLLYRMYAETSVRDGFVIRHVDYYRDAWGSFIQAGLAQPFIAEVENDGTAREPVAGLIAFAFARTAWYLYGMSRQAHREKMPNHLLQWEAMRWAKARGCTVYDFWGAPDEFIESDPMWGVWKFKEGFGGKIVRHIGAWDYAPSSTLYRAYTTVLPRILAMMRRRGKQATRAALAD
jgi:lipid II:glycine glycyltransferase (peptidoglycan interpeptide bridge formation enzyme)